MRVSKLRLWFLATRPFSFTASVVPVLVGSLLGFREAVRPLHLVLALVGAVAIHAGTNLVNDYYDHVKGADGPHSLGPSGVIQRGLLTPRAVLTAGLVCFAAGSAAGLLLVALTGPALLWLGVASVLAGFLYTAGPLALAYIGLGEVTVFVFMGPIIVLGAYYVQTERWAWTPVLVSLPVAFLVTAILHANNMRDIEDDRRTGKRTVATLIGRRWSCYEYYALVSGAYLALVGLVLTGTLPWTTLIALATVPLAVRAVRLAATATHPRRLNAVLANTARLHMRFGLLLSLGLAVGLLV
jgi:1,4-dihydroxy-2-naphthoate octaprenyltransferase